MLSALKAKSIAGTLTAKFLATLTAKSFAAYAALFPKFLQKIPNHSAAIILIETVLVSVFLNILRSLLNSLFSFHFFLLNDLDGSIITVDECCLPATQKDVFEIVVTCQLG